MDPHPLPSPPRWVTSPPSNLVAARTDGQLHFTPLAKCAQFGALGVKQQCEPRLVRFVLFFNNFFFFPLYLPRLGAGRSAAAHEPQTVPNFLKAAPKCVLTPLQSEFCMNANTSKLYIYILYIYTIYKGVRLPVLHQKNGHV